MDERGSILVETLVASAIVALVLGAALGIIGESARRSARADAARATLMEAQSRLAVAGIEFPLGAGSSEGVDGGLRWRVDVEPYGGTGLAGPLMRVSATALDPRVPGSRVTITSLRFARP